MCIIIQYHRKRIYSAETVSGIPIIMVTISIYLGKYRYYYTDITKLQKTKAPVPFMVYGLVFEKNTIVKNH